MPTDCGTVAVAEPEPEPDPSLRVVSCDVSVGGDGVLRGGSDITFRATVEVVGIDATRIQLTPFVGSVSLSEYTFQDGIDGPGTYEVETTHGWTFNEFRYLDWSGVPADGTQTVDAGVTAETLELRPNNDYTAESVCGRVEVYNDTQDEVSLSVVDYQFPSEVRPGETISWEVTFRNDGTQDADGTVQFQIYGTTVSADSVTFPAGGRVTASGSGRVDAGGLGPGSRLATKVVVDGPNVDFVDRTGLDAVTIAPPPSDPDPPQASDVQVGSCNVRDGQLTNADVEGVVEINNYSQSDATVSIRWVVPAEGVEIGSESMTVSAGGNPVMATPLDTSGLPPGDHDVAYEYDVVF